MKRAASRQPRNVESEFRISPNSKRVVYRADQETAGVLELFSVRLANGAITKLNAPLVTNGDVEEDFRISADSARVVYRAGRFTNGVMELFSVPVAGGASIKLNARCRRGAPSTQFRISSDGSQVVYLADQNVTGVFELYKVPIAGGEVQDINLPLVAIATCSPDSCSAQQARGSSIGPTKSRTK